MSTVESPPAFADTPAGRLRKKAAEAEEIAEDLSQQGDSEGADLAIIEAEAYSSEADELEGKRPSVRDGSHPEPLPQDAPELPDDLPPEEIVVAGLKMAYPNLGGKRPTSASLRLTGGKIAVAEGTAFKKGMTVRFSGAAVVNDVSQKDAHDASTQQVVSAEQVHKARITDLVIELPE